MSGVVRLIAVWVVGILGFAFGSDRADINVHRQVIHVFYARPLKDQIAAFSTYSFDEQYAIYIYGNQIRHPPAMYLAKPFGGEGLKVLVQLSSRLMKAESDATIRDVVLVFSEMSSQMAYDVAGDSQLMQLLSQSVARMKSDSWKAISEKELRSIRAEAAP
jgi:hypothetical protein